MGNAASRTDVHGLTNLSSTGYNAAPAPGPVMEFR